MSEIHYCAVRLSHDEIVAAVDGLVGEIDDHFDLGSEFVAGGDGLGELLTLKHLHWIILSNTN